MLYRVGETRRLVGATQRSYALKWPSAKRSLCQNFGLDDKLRARALRRMYELIGPNRHSAASAMLTIDRQLGGRTHGIDD
ncbi:MAG: hypothetical protein ACI8PT_002779 [Gammaproteobacteria bacterium]|jgi:hypothetical protein